MNEFRKDFQAMRGAFADRTGHEARDQNVYWAPIVVTRREIDAEAERLASLPLPSNGRRESLIVHPLAEANAPGFAPGIQVKLSVLKPGEKTAAFRHNATEVNFCIRGSGSTLVAGKRIAFAQYDVWNHPSYAVYRHTNDGKDLQVRLTYSNVPLLQHMQVYLPEDEPAVELHPVESEKGAVADDPRRKSPYGMIRIGADGGMLMPYEILINPEAVVSRPLHFPWKEVKRELDKLEALGKDYVGRRLYMMYNPVTGRTNGITPNFFATMTIRPPKIVDRPHRHVSAAINYYFHGTGYSTVAGNRYEWGPGDLMLSAPGWAVHNHASNDDHVYELTVQDQPLNIYMESLLWQENLKEPAALLGSEPGFETNRSKAAA
ncbi:MAG TPA: AraC family ligand binding domain-containing protein [Burkholderiales bacterium]|nr:AraC family ligand binding domain-containing protein [Burkholderiales bacterium]